MSTGTHEVLSRLEETTFGETLTPRCRQLLTELAEPVRVSRGQILFREGEVNHNVYILLKGRIDLTMTVPGRGSIRILTLGVGDIVAWSAVLGNGRMTCSAYVIEDSELLALPGHKLKALVERDCGAGAEFTFALAKALSKRLLATRLQLLDLFAANA